MSAMLARDVARKEMLKRCRLWVRSHSATRRTLELVLFVMAVVDAEDGLFAVHFALENAGTVRTASRGALITC
jgi:hypothetical protein